MIKLQPATDWPVPYLAMVDISGEVPGKCGECRKSGILRWVFYGRNVAKGPEHGGWYDGRQYQLCDKCIDAYVSESGDVRTEIKDQRPAPAIREAMKEGEAK